MGMELLDRRKVQTAFHRSSNCVLILKILEDNAVTVYTGTTKQAVPMKPVYNTVIDVLITFHTPLK